MNTQNSLRNEGKEIRPVGHEQGTTAYAVEPSVVAEETACETGKTVAIELTAELITAANELFNVLTKNIKYIRQEYNKVSNDAERCGELDFFWDMVITEIIAALHVAGYEPDFDYIAVEYKNPELVEEYEKLLEGDA